MLLELKRFYIKYSEAQFSHNFANLALKAVILQ